MLSAEVGSGLLSVWCVAVRSWTYSYRRWTRKVYCPRGSSVSLTPLLPRPVPSPASGATHTATDTPRDSASTSVAVKDESPWIPKPADGASGAACALCVGRAGMWCARCEGWATPASRSTTTSSFTRSMDCHAPAHVPQWPDCANLP